MIKEDYVSFETAKLLKEKGFDSDDVGCHGGFYSERCYESGHGIKTQSGQEVGIVYDDLTNSELNYDEYLRPTLQMARKWLREVHKLAINVEFQIDCPTWKWRIYHIEPLKGKYTNFKHYNTYEEACETAIRYILENLI